MSDSEASPTSTLDASFKEDPSRREFIGMAKLQLTIIDMTGMLSSQARKPIMPSEGSPSGSD